jgi:hypothetical protein
MAIELSRSGILLVEKFFYLKYFGHSREKRVANRVLEIHEDSREKNCM